MINKKYFWTFFFPILIIAFLASLIPLDGKIAIVNHFTVFLLIGTIFASLVVLLVKHKVVLVLKFILLAIVYVFSLFMIGLSNPTSNWDFKTVVALILCSLWVMLIIATIIYEYKNFDKIYKNKS